MTGCVTILCAAGTRDNAEAIAAALLDEKLAACIQIAPVESWYRWQGETRHEPEFVLHIKTIEALFHEIEARIRALHAYDLPEIVALPIVQGSAAYLRWIVDSVK